MHHVRKAAAAGLMSAGLVAAPIGVVAQADDPYPASEGWHYVNDRVVYRAGQGCDKRVVFKYWGHERILEIVDGERVPVTDPEWVPEAGDRFIGQSADSRLSLRASASGRKVKRLADGDWHLRVTPNGRNLRVWATGKNVYAGAGVRGFVWADGVQRFRLVNFRRDDGGVTRGLRIESGRRQQLCFRVGLRPVG